eukprot:gnl/MRDRNA2_/MRDRNA2_109531_c0_seq1.p1 gnl/MRDRNA2_/MRDRNA2_109531_c0~~gnl/MRDRNA2_/MRDRNA2_109531_c0_seq1.p1  ORF type:complete len:615 (+),score=121.17 gnl/MRDRNA2_/MRDRNA2_109531_c0_seq1:130-1845(+)
MTSVLLPEGTLRRGQSVQSVTSVISSSPTAQSAVSAVSYRSSAFQSPASSPTNLQRISISSPTNLMRSTSSQSGGMILTTISGGTLPWVSGSGLTTNGSAIRSSPPGLTPQGQTNRATSKESNGSKGHSEAKELVLQKTDTNDSKGEASNVDKGTVDAEEQQDSPNTRAMKQRAMVPPPLADIKEDVAPKALASTRGSYPPGFTPSSKVPAWSPLHFPPGFTPTFCLESVRSPTASQKIPLQSPVQSSLVRSSPMSSPSSRRTPSAPPTYGKELLLLQRGLVQQKRRLAGPAASPVAAQYASVQWPPPGITYDMVAKEAKQEGTKAGAAPKKAIASTSDPMAVPTISNPVPVSLTSTNTVGPKVVAPRVAVPPKRISHQNSFQGDEAVMFGSVALPSPNDQSLMFGSSALASPGAVMSSGCFHQPEMILSREMSLNAEAMPWSPSAAMCQAAPPNVELNQPYFMTYPPQMVPMPFPDPTMIQMEAFAGMEFQGPVAAQMTMPSSDQDAVFWHGSGGSQLNFQPAAHQQLRKASQKGGGKGSKSKGSGPVVVKPGNWKPKYTTKEGLTPAPR